MHICPHEFAAVMMVVDSVIPFMKAIYYTKILPMFYMEDTAQRRATSLES